jgi:hypothetical protein
MLFINEPGLYRLIFKSRKPEAESFKTWVFTEVLPSIRKTGAYAEPDADFSGWTWNNIRRILRQEVEEAVAKALKGTNPIGTLLTEDENRLLNFWNWKGSPLDPKAEIKQTAAQKAKARKLVLEKMQQKKLKQFCKKYIRVVDEQRRWFDCVKSVEVWRTYKDFAGEKPMKRYVFTKKFLHEMPGVKEGEAKIRKTKCLCFIGCHIIGESSIYGWKD